MFDCVGIVGVGLIGASIGLSLRQRRLCRQVLGIGRSVSNLEDAHQLRALDDYAVGIGPELAAADLVIFCAPVDLIVEHVLEAAKFVRPDCLLTDAGSAKGTIVRQLDERLGDGPKFVGSHPLAGSEKRGAMAAFGNLFCGKTCVVTPTEATDPTALLRIVEFWTALEMQVLLRSPEEHDLILGRTSHLPHLVASALASTLVADDRAFAGTGFRDTTRIASGDAPMWSAIFQHNRESVLDALRRYKEQLMRFETALKQNDTHTLIELLEDGKRNRDALGN